MKDFVEHLPSLLCLVAAAILALYDVRGWEFLIVAAVILHQ